MFIGFNMTYILNHLQDGLIYLLQGLTYLQEIIGGLEVIMYLKHFPSQALVIVRISTFELEEIRASES